MFGCLLFTFEKESNCDVQSGLQCLRLWSSFLGFQRDRTTGRCHCARFSIVFLLQAFYMVMKPENSECGYFTFRCIESIFSVLYKNKNSKKKRMMLRYWYKGIIFSSQTYIRDVSEAPLLDLTGKKGRNSPSLSILELLLCTLVQGFQSDVPSQNNLFTSLRN